MAATEPTPHDRRTTPVEAVVELFWFGVTAALVLSAAILVVAGPRVVDATGPRAALVALLALFALHSWRLHRKRGELSLDPRTRADRERRGF